MPNTRPYTIYIKKMPFVQHVMLRRYINLDDIVNRNMVTSLLMNGCQPIEERFPTAESIFQEYRSIPGHLIMNKDDMVNPKFCKKTGNIQGFENPIRFASYSPELELKLSTRKEDRIREQRKGMKPFEGVRVWKDKEKKKQVVVNGDAVSGLKRRKRKV